MFYAAITGYMKPQHGLGIPDLVDSINYRWNQNIHVHQYRWNEWERLLKDSADEELFIFAHSYGVSTALFLADQRPIYTLVSCDGIWRQKLERPSFSSFRNDHKLFVPKTVRYMYTFQQNIGWLQGHDFVLEDWSRTMISYAEDDVKGYKHWQMDRYPNFQSLVKELIR